jgi:hypothetical protein
LNVFGIFFAPQLKKHGALLQFLQRGTAIPNQQNKEKPMLKIE